MSVDYSAHLLAKHTASSISLQGHPWSLDGLVLSPLSMPHKALAVDRRELSKLMSEHHAQLAAWTSDWDMPIASEWWWICCDMKDYTTANIPSSRGRRAIRKGLEHNAIRPLDVNEFIELSYPIYRSALLGYGQVPPAKADYEKQIRSQAQYPGAEYWGAFYDGQMSAYAACKIVDNAVILGSTKSDPKMNKFNANAALFYSLTKHYLEDGRLYITNGTRTLWHPTSINEYLERLGYRKVYCRAHVKLAPLLRWIDRTRVVKWGRYLGLPHILKTRWEKLNGVRQLVKISESFQ